MMKQIILALATLSFPAVVTYVSAAYHLNDLPSEQRTSICDKNVAFCLNACLQKVSSNLCAVSTMQFSCICQDGSVPVDMHYFPIQAQQCVGENQDCRNACAASGKSGQALDTCSNLCDQHYVCGTPNAKEEQVFQAPPDVVASALDNNTSSATHPASTPIKTSSTQLASNASVAATASTTSTASSSPTKTTNSRSATSATPTNVAVVNASSKNNDGRMWQIWQLALPFVVAILLY